MRDSCFKEITRLALENDRIWLVTADMGFGLVDGFRHELRHRFINVGVSEQNMIGVSAGLALSGKVVFCYSIGNFPTFRCLEQIRNDLCHHNLNVNIVAGGTGVTYGALGYTHHAVEDIAVMRSLPNMSVISPGTPKESARLTELIVDVEGPSYIRLGMYGYEELYHMKPDLTISRISEIYKGYTNGKKVTLLATGSMVPLAEKASLYLRNKNISARVSSVHTINPIDERYILDVSKDSCLLVTIEEHSISGGLGSAVSEVISGVKDKPVLLRKGIFNNKSNAGYCRSELLRLNRLTVNDIVSEVIDRVG